MTRMEAINSLSKFDPEKIRSKEKRDHPKSLKDKSLNNYGSPSIDLIGMNGHNEGFSLGNIENDPAKNIQMLGLAHNKHRSRIIEVIRSEEVIEKKYQEKQEQEDDLIEETEPIECKDSDNLPRIDEGKSREKNAKINPQINRLEKLGLKSNPFRSYTYEDAALDDIMVGREDEVKILEAIIDFYKLDSKKNAVLIGEDGIGKTSIIQILLKKLYSKCYDVNYYPILPSFKNIILSLAQDLEEDLNNQEDLREISNKFLNMFLNSKSESILILDNLEDLLGCSKVEREEYVRMFRGSNVLFICAATLDGWKKLIEEEPSISGAFTQIYIRPLDIDQSCSIIKKRLDVSRISEDNGYFPFTEEAIKTIATYAFFVPGKIIDFTSRMMIETIIKNYEEIDERFVRRVLLQKSAFFEIFKQLSGRQVKIIEEIIKNGGEANFNYLSEAIGISRVAIADHIQKLVDLGLVEYIDAQGREKFFKVTDKMKVLIG
ncbi:MAG: winged helix-turn-helix transcriptional regulator [Halobacteriota archaeon]|nr:winged helix-turn-helix transcriptional regulator [Halobacteriota archaeon]